MGTQCIERVNGLAPASQLGTVALYDLASCRTGARARSCRVVRHSRCSSRASSARPRCCGIHTRSACDLLRWGHSAQIGLGGWRPSLELSTVISCFLASHRTGARTLSCRAVPNWRCSIRAPNARPFCCGSHAMCARDLDRWGYSAQSGPGGWRPLLELRTAPPYCLAPSLVPVRALYLSAPSHTGGAPAVPLAHDARATVAFTRGARVTAIDGHTVHGAGLGTGARQWSSASLPYTT